MSASIWSPSSTVPVSTSTSRSILSFGAIGDGTTDDTVAVGNAFASGEDIYVPRGYTFAITGNVTGFVDNQLIWGAGTFKKLGSTIAPMFLLPDESDGVQFIGIGFDGNNSLFSAGNAVPAILGYVTKSLNVHRCRFKHIIDCGIKLRDGAYLTAMGNYFYDVNENGIELHNYAVDVRTGLAYTSDRPLIEGHHTIIGNRFEKITRYENPAGPLVDACGIAFYGATGYPQRDVRIQGNFLIDCLRGIWTENNTTDSAADGVIITGNTIRGGVNGGTADNIYGKAGIGIIAAKNVTVADNVIRNPANTNPVGTETAGIIVSGSAGVEVGSKIDILNNTIIDDSGLADRTEWGIYCLVGDDLTITGNRISGTATGKIYLDPTYVTNARCYNNTGAETKYEKGCTETYVFTRENIPANGTQVTYAYGTTFESEIPANSDGRLIGVSVKLSTPLTTSTLQVQVLANGVAETDLTINAVIAGATVYTAQVAESSGLLVTAGQLIKVNIITGATFAPTTMDAIVTVIMNTQSKK